MKEIQTLYDSRTGATEDQWRRWLTYYSRTLVTLMQVEERDHCCCGRCGVRIVPSCFVVVILMYYVEDVLQTFTNTVEHRYCRDCCIQDLILDHYGTINWDEYACNGNCSVVHMTWRSPYGGREAGGETL